MANNPTDSSTVKDYEDRIKQLEKKLSDLEALLNAKSTPTSDAKKSSVEDKPKSEPTIEDAGPKIEASSIIEGVVGGFIPGLGNIIKALENTSPEFRKRIAETDSEIKHRIDVGWSSKPVVDYSISTRPLRRGPPSRSQPRAPPEVKVPRGATAPEREPIVDILEESDYLSVVAELPGVDEKDLTTSLKDNVLEIRAGQFLKTIQLPGKTKEITDHSFKNGILQLRIPKE